MLRGSGNTKRVAGQVNKTHTSMMLSNESRNSGLSTNQEFTKQSLRCQDFRHNLNDSVTASLVRGHDATVHPLHRGCGLPRRERYLDLAGARRVQLWAVASQIHSHSSLRTEQLLSATCTWCVARNDVNMSGLMIVRIVPIIIYSCCLRTRQESAAAFLTGITMHFHMSMSLPLQESLSLAGGVELGVA